MNQDDLILDHLKKGNSLTPLEALNLFGCFRLGARIWDLKRSGHDIKTVMVSNGKKKFAKYYIEQPKITIDKNQYSFIQ